MCIRDSLNGTARLFRANIIKPGTNDFVDGFDRDQVSIDGVNFSEPVSYTHLGWAKWHGGGKASSADSCFHHPCLHGKHQAARVCCIKRGMRYVRRRALDHAAARRNPKLNRK